MRQGPIGRDGGPIRLQMDPHRADGLDIRASWPHEDSPASLARGAAARPRAVRPRRLKDGGTTVANIGRASERRTAGSDEPTDWQGSSEGRQ